MRPERIVPLSAASRRRPTPTARERVIYELARLRIAATHEPAPRFTHLACPHD